MKKHSLLIAGLLATLCISHGAIAQYGNNDNDGYSANEQRQGPPGGGKRQPPEEAFTACEGQTENAAVTVVTPHGHELEATCQYMHGDALVAIPNNRPERPQR